LLWGFGIALVFVVGLVLAAWWTMIRMPGTSHQGPLPPADEDLRALADELRGDVVELAEKIGERHVPGRSEPLARAADYLEGRLTAAGYDVRRQVFQAAGCDCSNLEVEIPGRSHPDQIVVIGAHYDSAPGTPGANDNGSAVAALVALAERFSGRATGRTLRFVAFANEEPPYFQSDAMGSWVYARRCRKRGENVTAMLSLETMGYFNDAPGSQQYPAPFGMLYPSTGNFIGVVGNVSSGSLVRRVVGTFRRNEPFPCEGGALPSAVPGIGFSDHWSFWQEGYSAAMITDTAMYRYPYYHHPADTPDKIDFLRLARVVRGLQAVIADLVAASR
jgi:hypothetical protein